MLGKAGKRKNLFACVEKNYSNGLFMGWTEKKVFMRSPTEGTKIERTFLSLPFSLRLTSHMTKNIALSLAILQQFDNYFPRVSIEQPR